MRIVIVATWYPQPKKPIPGSFIQEQAQALSRLHEVTVIAAEQLDFDEFKGLCSGPVTEMGVRVYRHRWWHIPVIWPALWLLSFFLCALRIDWHNVDLIHAHVALPGGFAAALLKRFVHKPLILTEHMGPFAYLMESFPKRVATRYAFRHIDAVVTVSETLAKNIQAYYLPGRYFVIPNIVNLQRFNLDIVTELAPSPIQVLWVGRFTPGDEKGASLCLAAIQTIYHERGACFHVTLVGGGESLAGFQHKVQEMDLAEMCTFTGEVSPTQMPGLMQACHFFVSSSLGETFGVVLIEAMACGKPVVATRCGGPEDIVKPEVGILVEAGNAQALADGILQMMDTYKSYDPKAIADYVARSFGVGVVTDRLTHLYQQISNENNISNVTKG
jgi:glycosyltransferase involved in cell wall biosynthesis